jgi:Cu-processing system permease protein
MRALRALVQLSFFEFIRDRIVWTAIFVAGLLFAISLLLGSLSFNEQQRILSHIGWSTIQLASLGLGLVIAANWLHKEMDRQTCLIVLSRPISRDQFLVGKFLPIALLIFLLQALLAGVLYFLLGFSFSLENYLKVFLGTFLEVLSVVAICFFIATLTRPSIAFLSGIAVFLIGHWSQEIQFFGEKIQSPIYILVAKIGKYFFPNLFQFNWRSTYFLEAGVSNQQVFWVLVHGCGWIILLISLAAFVFRRKDLV